MGEKKVVNLSRFLLFEEAGDSGADFDGKMALDYDQDNAVEADDDDDAESCSSDVGCYGSAQSREAQIGISEGDDEQVHNETHCDDDDVDYDDGMRNSIHAIGSHHHHHHHHKLRAFEEEEEEEEMTSEVTSTANSYNSRKCVQSSKKNMSEMEKSRLFWEACLAS